MFKRLLFAAMLALFAATWCSAAPKGKTVYTTTVGKYRIVSRTNCPRAWTKVGATVEISTTVSSDVPGFFSAQLFVNGIAAGKPQILEIGKTAKFSAVPKTPGTVSVICTVPV